MANKNYECIKELKALKRYILDPKETLLVFDVDYTLTHPKEPAFQYATFRAHASYIRAAFDELAPDQKDLFSSLMVFHVTGNDLIEKDTPKLLTEWQKAGCSLIALTACLTTTLNDQCLVKTRIQHLKEHGIDFSKSFPDFTDRAFKHINVNFGAHPHFSQGVLFTNGENKQNYKGELLCHFLMGAKKQFKKIILIDDRIQNLAAVQHSLGFHFPSADYTGLHFLGALDYPSQDVSLEDFKKFVDPIFEEVKRMCPSEENA